ncbi:helix-turn-helix transcriptional regulator [Marinomonas sp. 15G1-11]|uniref:Helix-turn-helix transcriptional regulator n=1 Tax=Marinomonas phaeophyticola TaxID=3004091 RepID=A0ABT4JRR5_9GAMM|nr:helix-turn-helix transcriptional regulator [Marinomonas sp. 15G1-11]MCZ2721018.1 helix-turn-helix transcriptional regulator [Marinomonas sp. 15G1-11]
MILFHEDYLRGHELQSQLKKCRFFDYAVNEALHLSPKEQQLICRIFDSIEAEYHSSYDALSREIMLSQMSTLLRYAERFYRRQFLVRKEFHSSIYESFNNLLYQYMYVSDVYRTPSISDIAQQLNMTPRYLTDALKVETGKSAKEWIQLALVDKAKNLLLSSNDSVATVAYSLGFEYPQYFSRLFKNKVGITPTEYRKQTARH